MNSYIKNYPRPQLVRPAWTDLNGTWKFQFDDHDKGENGMKRFRRKRFRSKYRLHMKRNAAESKTRSTMRRCGTAAAWS